MPDVISTLTCGEETITLLRDENGYYHVTHRSFELDLPEGRYITRRDSFATCDKATVAFTRRVVCLMTVYAEGPVQNAVQNFIKKVCA